MRSMANWVFKEDLQKLNASWAEFKMKYQNLFTTPRDTSDVRM